MITVYQVIRRTLAVAACALLISPAVHADTLWVANLTGLWDNGGNWNNGVPGSPGDVNPRQRDGGTINVTAGNPATGSGTVANFRMNDDGDTRTNTVNWDPGNSNTYQITNEIRVGDNASNGAAVFNHDSGEIRTGGWYHIGRQGTATYTISNSATIFAGARLSIGELSSGGNEGAALIMNGSSSFTEGSVQNSNLGYRQTAKGTLIQNGSSSANYRALLVGYQNSAQGTWIMNDASTATVNNNVWAGRYDTGSAYFELNDSAQMTQAGGGFGLSMEQNRGTSSQLVMNGSSRFTSNGWFELGGGQATMTMNDNAFFDSNSNFRIGQRNNVGAPGDGVSRLIMNQNAFLDGNGGDFYVGFEGNSDGLIEMNGTSRIIDSHMGVSPPRKWYRDH